MSTVEMKVTESFGVAGNALRPATNVLLQSAASATLQELRRARERLSAALSQFQPEGADILLVARPVEEFMAVLRAVPGAEAEVYRRATLVVTRCAPGSAFHGAWRAATESIGRTVLREPEQTSSPPRSHWLVGQLPAFPGLMWLDQVWSLRMTIDRLLEVFAGDSATQESLQMLRDECVAICRESANLAVDGCWFLHHLPNATVESSLARETLRWPNDQERAWWAAEVAAATETLVAWAEDQSRALNDGMSDTEVGEEPLQPKLRKKALAPRGGREHRVPRRPAREKIISALTKHHRYAEGGCLNFEPIGVKALAKLACVSCWTAGEFFRKEFGGRKNYARACATKDLAMLLKVLRGEVTPRNLLGKYDPADGRE